MTDTYLNDEDLQALWGDILEMHDKRTFVQSASGAEVVTDGCAIYSVEGEGRATQDGTPTPDNPVEIEVARGRNLNSEAYEIGTINANTGEDNSSTTRFRTPSASAIAVNAGVYSVSFNAEYLVAVYVYDGSTVKIDESLTSWQSTAFTLTLTAARNLRFVLRRSDNATITQADMEACHIQLELGTTPSPYVPYGCVGLEVQSLSQNQDDWVNRGITDSTGIPSPNTSTTRVSNTSNNRFDNVMSGREYKLVWNGSNIQTAIYAYDGEGNYIIGESSYSWHSSPFTWVSTNTQKVRVVVRKSDNSAITPAEVMAANVRLVSTTPIPLPAKGFAASLPDGTADALTVDSAGRWEWVNEIARIASYNGESVGNVYLSTTGQLTTGAEVYYKSSQASEHGYIDVPAIPDGSTVSIPELLEIGVAWFVHGAKELVEHATNERKRVEEALADVYEAIADL